MVPNKPPSRSKRSRRADRGRVADVFRAISTLQPAGSLGWAAACRTGADGVSTMNLDASTSSPSKESIEIMSPEGKIYIGVDIGGTFTDVVAYDEASGEWRIGKVLPSSDSPEKGVMDAIERVIDPSERAPTD